MKKSSFRRHRLSLEDLKYRNQQLKVASEISKSASTILDPDKLMQQVAELIAERLDYYFVGIYLVDKDKKFAFLKAGSGQIGKKLRKSKVRLDGGSIVAWSIRNKKAGISLTSDSNSEKINKSITKTKSEIAIPIVTSIGVIGSICIHDEVENAFSEDDIVILNTITDHLSIAIENARLHKNATKEIESRKETEVALKESLSRIEFAKQEWESTANSLPQVICLLDKDGNVIFANKAIEEWNLGSRKDIKDVFIHELLHKNCKNPFCYMDKFWGKAKKSLQEGNTYELETEDEVLNKFISIQVRPISNHKNIEITSGQQSFAVVVFQDITERKSSEEMWKRYEFVVNAFKEYMTLIDKDNVYRAVNEAYCQAHEKSREDIVGHSVSNVWGRKVYREKIKPNLDKCFRGNVIYYQAWFEFPALGRRYWDVACYPYCDKDGSVPYIVVVSRDITDRKRTEAELMKETEIRREMTKIAAKLSKASGDRLEIVLNEICQKTAELMDARKVYISLNSDIIASDTGVLSLPWRINGKKKREKIKTLKIKIKPTKVKLLARSKDVNASIYVFSKKQEYDKRDKELIQIIANTLSLALEVSLLEDKSRKLKVITDKVIFMDSEDFQKKAEDLDGKSFSATYLVSDTVDSVKQKINQSDLQRLLKSIVIKNGAIWGNAWGDMIHAVFSNHFVKTKEGHELSAYRAGIEICNTVRDKLGFTMRVGIATGKLKVNKDTIQMDQLIKSRTIEKSFIAQEGRVGITTIQKPSIKLKKNIERFDYEFKHSEDLVRGSLESIWKLYPKSRKNNQVRIKKKKYDRKGVSYDTSLKLLLTKGVCGHGHLEGGPISTDVIKVLRRVGKYYQRNGKQQKRFYQLTGKRYSDIMKSLDNIISWGESRREFDFSAHFLPWLYLMKLGESSTPDLIYELTKAQIKNDLNKYAGITREISPTIWLEMDLNYTECIAAFVKALEDVLKDELICGPIKIGVGIKRQFLARFVDQSINKFISSIEYPYLKCLKLVSALKQSSVLSKIDIYINTIDVAKTNPLFGYKSNPRRGTHTKTLYKEARNLDTGCHVHMLEELVDKKYIAQGQDRIKEFPYILKLFKILGIKGARFIHMAYWPEELPYLGEMKSSKHEIVVCQTSTQMLGAMHKPKSSFLLANKKVLEGILFDDDFPRVLLGTDDSGPFNIRNIWEELLKVMMQSQNGIQRSMPL